LFWVFGEAKCGKRVRFISLQRKRRLERERDLVGLGFARRKRK